MTKLEDRLIELGLKTVQLPSGLEVMQKFHDDEINMSNVTLVFSNMMDLWREYKEVQKDLENSVGLSYPLREELVSDNDFPSYLALGLLDHDLGSVVSPFPTYVELYDTEVIRDKLQSEEALYYRYENARIFLSAVSRISAKNPFTNVTVPFNEVGNLLNGLMHKAPEVKAELVGDHNINSEIYVAVAQIIKNCHKNMIIHKLSGEISLVGMNKQDSTVLIVEDSGSGIDPEKMALLSFGYTSEGTGLGLMVSKYVLQMHGGVIDISSGAYRTRLGSGDVINYGGHVLSNE